MKPLANRPLRVLAPVAAVATLLVWTGVAAAGGRDVRPDPTLAPAVAGAREAVAEGYNRLRATMISEPRKIVLINEGDDDISTLQEPSTIFQTPLAMTAVVRERNSLPVLSTLTPRTEAGFGGGINRRIDETNEMIRERARAAAVLAELYPAFKGNDRLYSDRLHPNANGHKVMAEVWFRSLLPVLNNLLETQDLERALDDAAAQALKPGRADRLR